MSTIPRAVAAVAAVPLRPPCFDQVEDLQKLQKAAHKITSILDLDPLIDNIVNDVARSFGCLEAGIYLHDEERGEMVLAGVHGCSVNHKGHRMKIGKEGMVGYVASTGQMRYAPDVRKDHYYIACEKSALSEVVIPLHVGERLVGVFTASHPELDGFPRQQLRILQALCDHVAVAVDNARRSREESLVRSPLDGVVVQIFSRQGERIAPAGIAKIVDMSQLRVLADVDELHVARLKPGGKVEITFRGSPTVYKGTISRVAPTVKRMQRVEPDGASSTDARVVQVEIEFDDPSTMPQVLGRETRVTFL